MPQSSAKVQRSLARRSSASSSIASASIPSASPYAASSFHIAPEGSSVLAAIRGHLPVLGNCAYIGLASGFLMTDVLALRILLACGYSGLVTYHALQPRPLRIPLMWSAVFVAVNAFAASKLAADRFPSSLSEEEEELHASSFPQLTKGQFKQLLEMGERVVLPRDTVLTREADRCEYLYFLKSGRAKLYLHDTYYADIGAGGFVNDVAFQQGPDVGAYGTVICSARDGCELIAWRQDELADHLNSRPEMRRNLNHVLVATLVKGLMMQREAAHARAGRSWALEEAPLTKPPTRTKSRLSMTQSEMHLREVPVESICTRGGTVMK